MTNAAKMAQIKYQYQHKDKLSNDIYKDIELTKKFFVSLAIPPSSINGLEGYVQEIVHDPFGFLLISDIQVIQILACNKNIYIVLIFF